MKKFYRISWNVDSPPLHLFSSIILSIYIMLFINTFIGSMGGIPAFIAFMAVYYILRGMIIAGNRISHQLAMESKVEIRYLMVNYGIIYMIVWFIMRAILLLSKFSGWGNIKKLEFSEYFRNLYGSSMLEKWAYIFAGILMFAYIMSLFPLVVIKKNRHWFVYLFADSSVFAIVCMIIAKICRLFIDNDLEARAVCVLDDMLLCKLPGKLQAVLYMIGIIIFTLAVIIGSYNFSKWIYGPKPGKLQVSDSLVKLEQKKKFKVPSKRTMNIFTVGVIIAAILVMSIIGVFFFAPSEDTYDYEKVAECLTNDNMMGPMVYNETIYAPTDLELNYHEDGIAYGYAGYKEQDCTSRFYRLAIANVLYGSQEQDEDLLEMYGAEYNCYMPIEQMELDDNWKNDTVFLIWDEDWENESAYSNDKAGYTECQKNLIESLENKFGEVEYSLSDFEDYDAFFTIRGYKTIKEAEEREIPYGDWVGIILVKDNGFYYGNYDNKIQGIQLHTLLDVLGGK